MKLINVGHGNYVNSGRIVAVMSPETAPVKRLAQEAKDAGRALDVTCGKRTRSVIVTDSDHVVLCAVRCETIEERISGAKASSDGETDE